MEKTKDIFKNAKAGDVFLCHEGHMAIYLRRGTTDPWDSRGYTHELVPVGRGGVILCNDDGSCIPSIINDYNVVAKWRGYHQAKKPYDYRPDLIVRAVCYVFRTDIRDIREHSRKRELVYPRQALCYYLSKLTTLNSGQIGGIIDKDHATAAYHAKAWENQLMYAEVKEKDKLVYDKLKGL